MQRCGSLAWGRWGCWGGGGDSVCELGVFGLPFGVFMLSEGLWDRCFGGFVRRSMGSVFFCGWEISDVVLTCLIVSAL